MVDFPDIRWCVVCSPGKSWVSERIRCCYACLLCVCSSCLWIYFRGCSFHFQKSIGCDFRDDWSGGKRRCCYNTSDLLQRFDVLDRNGDYLHGDHDHSVHPPNMSDILSPMGWYVLRS
uniref:Uncharacterized protein n=1 Tax=Opuntia streptacantha TaxID=393608 RepID=A0A7C8YXC7_OPUST